MASIVDQETDARFWAQTGYKPGQKLDPHDPQDKAMVPVWIDIRDKVQREYDAGKLVTTFDHPVLTLGVGEAHAANQAAIAHLDAAQKAPDEATAQQNLAASAAASQEALRKMQEVMHLQPPTVSPQLTHEASQEAAQQQPPPEAPAHEHVANAQAQAAHKPSPRGIVDKETDARFWAQTHFKPGQKLDPNDPTDKAMIPVWLDIYRKVKAEDRAGKLVLTYNNPVVAQNLADARVADQVAAAHLDTAAASPEVAHENAAAAAVAAQVSAHKTREAASVQPPTVSPKLAHEASHRSNKDAELDMETYHRFWAQTRYKPGRRLDPRDPRDARMIPYWQGMRHQIEQEHHHRRGHLPTGRDRLAQEQAKGVGHRAEAAHRGHGPRRHPVQSSVPQGRLHGYRDQATRVAHEAGAPYVLVIQHPDGSMEHHGFGSRAELDAAYAKISDQHDQYRYVGAFDLAANANTPVHDSVGVPAAEHVEEPPPPAPEGAEGGPPPQEILPVEKPKWSIGKIAAVGAAAIAGIAGIAYVAKRGGGRKVSVASSARARPARAMARMPGA